MCFAAGKSSGSTLNTSGASAWALPTGLASCSCLVACQSDCGRTRRLMNRRDFISLVGGAATAWPLAARAQQPAMPVIGVMSPLSVATAARNLAALRNGLRDLGYSEGRNIKIEYRFADGAPERYPALMAELIVLKPVMIVVGSTPAIVAASKVTGTTPLVWIGVADDPVALGLVGSFAHPGGNITGFLMSGDAGIVGKRLELLREAAPRFSRVGVLVAPDYAAADGTLDALPSAAGGWASMLVFTRRGRQRT